MNEGGVGGKWVLLSHPSMGLLDHTGIEAKMAEVYCFVFRINFPIFQVLFCFLQNP